MEALKNNEQSIQYKHQYHHEIKDEIDIVNEFKNLFYQNQFTFIINEIDKALAKTDHFGDYFKLSMIKAKSFFELNYREKAVQTLIKHTENESLYSHPDFLYAKGTLFYFQNQYEKAQKCFISMQEQTDNPMVHIKAKLALANIAMAIKNEKLVEEYIHILEQMKENFNQEIEISFYHLKANYLMNGKKKLSLAYELLEKSYSLATDEQWSYFKLRTLYQMSKFHIQQNDIELARGILYTINLETKYNDMRFLSHLINLEFEKIDFRSQSKIELCEKSKAIFVGHKNQYKVELYKWPKLFTIIKLLFESDTFISKEKIAQTLWIEEKYLPNTHDARIYDLISRLKKKLELADGIDLLIESKNGGYRLCF